MKFTPHNEAAALETLPGQYAYRYEDTVRTTGYDAWSDSVYRLMRPSVTISLRCYPVLKFTPKGFWIDYYGIRKFVLRGARKKFACLSIARARTSFIARKNAQARIYRARLDGALIALEAFKRRDSDEADRRFGQPHYGH